MGRVRAARIVLVVCAATLAVFGGPAVAIGQPSRQPQEPVRLRLTMGDLKPRVITSATGTLTVTGKITNVGDRRLDDLQVRVQRGQPETSEQQMRDALGHDQPTEAGGRAFTAVVPALAPGQSADLKISVPVTADGPTSLGITEPGVYPLLVNVNGKPEFGGTARLATVGALLPVLSVPGGRAGKAPPGPAKITMLWPLVDDRPRVLRTDGDKAVLTDDGLARSLATGGRLDGLLSAAVSATSSDSDLSSSLCFAIDPDLLETAEAMARGYLVIGKDGHTAQGTGATAADVWLDRLRTLVDHRCVIALPYADADLVALSRSGAVDLEQLALSGSDIVQRVLRVDPLPGVVWPDRGTLDQRTLSDLSSVGPVTVLADPAKVQRSSGSAPWTLGTSSSSTRVLPVDGLVAAALGDQHSAQDTLAVLAYRVLFDGNRGERVLIAPPRRWSLPTDELAALLSQVSSFYRGSFATAAPLADQITGPADGTAAGLAYTGADNAAEIPVSVTNDMERVDDTQRDLVNAMQEDPTTKVDPRSLIQPLQYGLVRATSTAFRGHTDQAKSAVRVVRGQLNGMIAKVSVRSPGPPISLGSQNAPLPVIVTNQLPVAMQVKIKLSEVPGLQPAPLPVRIVPAGSNVTVFAESKVLRSGRFTVDVSLQTPSGGTTLGQSARLELHSTSYGMITVIITGLAAGILVLLSGRRIFRRVRAARAQRATAPVQQGQG